MTILGFLSRRLGGLLSPSGRPVRPTRVIMEPTNRCNLNCPFCLVGKQNELVKEHGNAAHDLMSRPMGFMPEDVFERFRQQCKAFGIKHVYLHFQGEPFLNRKTPSFAHRLKQDGLSVGVFTNGMAFTDASIAELAAAEIDLIRFSVDGASEETYQRNRVGGRLATVLDAMEKMAAAHRGRQTRLEWQFLALKNNEHEIDTARAMAEKIGVHFFVKGFRETDPALAPSNPAYRSSFRKKPCTDIHKQLGVYWNGDVVPCCYDVDASEVMGNIMDASLEDIWNGGKYRAFRAAVDQAATAPREEPALCRACLRWK